MDATHLCFRLRQARELIGISRSELARRIGVKPSAAIQWEHENGTHPSTAHLVQIATVTGVAFEWIATGRGPPRPNPELPDEQAVARDLFEESLLKLARRLPVSARTPLIELIRSVSSS